MKVGDCITKYRKQKLVMAPGSEPDTVKELLVLLEPHVYGTFKKLKYNYTLLFKSISLN